MKLLRSMPKEKLQKIAFVVILTLIALGGMGNFWIVREWSAWTSTRDQIAKLATEIDRLQTVASQEASNTDLRDKIKAFVETQQQRMVSGDPFSWFVREVSLLAEKHPVRVRGMHPGETAPNTQRSRYDIFTARLEVEGTFDHVGTFIRDFENSFSTSQIRSLEMSAPDPTRSVCRSSFECAIPILPRDAAPTAANPLAEPKT